MKLLNRLFMVRFSHERGGYRYNDTFSVVTTSIERAIELARKTHNDKKDMAVLDVTHKGTVDAIDAQPSLLKEQI